MSSNPPTQQPQRKPRISLRAAGSTYDSPAADRIGQEGAAYRYGTAIVGGHRNLWSDGQTCYPLIDDNAFAANINLYLGGGTFRSAITDGAHGLMNSYYVARAGAVRSSLIANGEAQKLTASTGYAGAFKEAFPVVGTVSQVTNGGSTVVLAGGAAINNLAGYAYTPNRISPQPGDILAVTVAAVVYYYRLVSTTGLNLTIFPAWQQASAGPGAGYTFACYRTGYGSRSRAINLQQPGFSELYTYYAGNLLAPGNGLFSGFTAAGTIECLTDSTNAHTMSPKAWSGAAYVNEIEANDIAFYKSFMLYGAGSSVGWSVAGFPTAFPFGAHDFPSGNIAVLDPSDEFVSFEYLGDQVVAIFERSMWLARATGTVPEFDFQKIPDVEGPSSYYQQDAELFNGCINSSRPTTAGRGAVYYVSTEGLMVYDYQTPRSVSVPIDGAHIVPATRHELCYEPTTESVIWTSQGFGDVAWVYNASTNNWSSLDVSLTFRCVNSMSAVAYGFGGNTAAHRPFRLSYWKPDSTVHGFSATINGLEFTGDTTFGDSRRWSWASPIVYVSDVYTDWTLGGIAPRIRRPTGGAAPFNLRLQIYGGSTPETMILRKTIDPFEYSAGTVSARGIVGPTEDDAYLAVVLSGTRWGRLVGCDLFPSDTDSRR